MRNFKLLYLIVIVILLASCASYYRKNQAVMEAIYNGDFDGASEIVESRKIKKKKRNQLLYYLNKGTILFMANKPVESTNYFRQADYFIEDYQKNYARNAASFISNPSIQIYEGESFEKILLHYYTVLNYLQLNQLDEALIECKRMQLKMQKNNDFFKNKNKYKNDAFVNLLMGIVYDAQADYNNAYIAYKNAYEIYKTEYAKSLQTNVPHQLKLDLIRTATLTGFTNEASDFKEEFKLPNYQPEVRHKSNLVSFWNNGFGPVKDQWSINFTITPGGDGWVNFVNWDLGINLPFYVGNDAKSLQQLNIIRVAFPKYISRLPFTSQAELSFDSLTISSQFELAEPIDKIAYTSLNDRMLKELSEALVRLALKQVAALATKKENEGVAAALSIVNAITEQADTRNWQTLPYSINYTRTYLPAGQHHGTFKSDKTTTNFSVTIKPNKTTFKVFQTPYFKTYSQQSYNIP